MTCFHKNNALPWLLLILPLLKLAVPYSHHILIHSFCAFSGMSRFTLRQTYETHHIDEWPNIWASGEVVLYTFSGHPWLDLQLFLVSNMFTRCFLSLLNYQSTIPFPLYPWNHKDPISNGEDSPVFLPPWSHPPIEVYLTSFYLALSRQPSTQFHYFLLSKPF